MPKELYCQACMRMRPFDAKWRALYVNADGNLMVTTPENGGNPDYERPDTVFACGQRCSLVLCERYLHTCGFDTAHALNLAKPGHTGSDLTGYLI